MESRETYKSTKGLFARDELERQLQRILKTSPFCDSPRQRNFLSFVVTKTFDENPDVITSYEIAIDAFGRSPDFDPSDPYIRNIAVLVRKGLNSYYNEQLSNPASKDRIRIEIPRGNYRASFSIFNNNSSDTNASTTIKEQYTGPGDSNIIENRADLKPRVKSINKNLRRTDEFISIKPVNRFDSSTHTGHKPILAIKPFVSFGNAKSSQPESIGEILSAEIITGFSHSDSFRLVSFSNAKFTQEIKKHSSTQPSINANYLLNGKYQIVEGIILLNVELSENVPGVINEENISYSNTVIVFSELLRIELDSFYSKKNEELQNLSKRIKVELNHLAIALHKSRGTETVNIKRC